MAIDPAEFFLSDDDRRLIAARLKLPFDEAVVISELLLDECRAYLDRQSTGLEDGEALLPEAAILAAWTDMEREKFGRIGALAAALAKALGEVADGMEASGHGASAEFGIDLAALAGAAAPGATPDDRWQELWERAPSAIAGALTMIEQIQKAADFAMPRKITAGKKVRGLDRMVLKMRDHLEWALPVGSKARDAFEARPASGNSPLVQVVGIGLDAMRAAVKAGAGDPGCVPNLKDLPAQIGRILKKEKAGLDRLDAELGQK